MQIHRGKTCVPRQSLKVSVLGKSHVFGNLGFAFQTSGIFLYPKIFSSLCAYIYYYLLIHIIYYIITLYYKL